MPSLQELVQQFGEIALEVWDEIQPFGLEPYFIPIIQYIRPIARRIPFGPFQQVLGAFGIQLALEKAKQLYGTWNNPRREIPGDKGERVEQPGAQENIESKSEDTTVEVIPDKPKKHTSREVTEEVKPSEPQSETDLFIPKNNKEGTAPDNDLDELHPIQTGVIPDDTDMPGDANQAGGDTAIFGQDDADLTLRAAGAYSRTFKRIYEVQFGQTTSNAEINALETRLAKSGTHEIGWYVVPLDSALPQSIMPRQWAAMMQDARRVRIKGCSVRCSAFSPYITTTTQNLQQIAMIPNSYFYYVVDHPRILPGYNYESSYYSTGRSDMYGTNVLKKWRITGEPFVGYGSYKSTPTTRQEVWDQMSLDLFNHPNFSMMKQTDELNVKWTNTAEDEWFHSGIPWATNLDYSAAANYNQSAQAREYVAQGYGTRLNDPNVTWGGNPSFVPYSDTGAQTYNTQSPWWCVDADYTDPIQRYLQQGIPAGMVGQIKTQSAAENNTEAGNMMWSKRMMDLLPKTKRPPPRILVRPKETPEAGSTVTWTMMMELTCTLEIIPNSMGYLPLNLGDAFPGWCGDNMFGMRTAPNGLIARGDRSFKNSSTQGLGYKLDFRSGNYAENTDEFPIAWKRNDYFTSTRGDTYEAYLEEDGPHYYAGVRRQQPDPYF